MNWFTDRHFFLLAVVVYGVSTVYSVSLWRKGFRRDNRVNYLLLLAGFLLHITAMSLRGFSLQHCPVNNLFEATMFVGWTIVTAYLVIGLFSTLRFLGAFVSPVLFFLGVFALMPALDPPAGPTPEFSGALRSLHAATILQAYGAFGLAAVAAAMFLAQQHDLKVHKLRALLSLLPSMQRLELITTRLVLAGFALLTLGLAVGSQLPRQDGAPFFADTKVLWSGLMWLVYLEALAAHQFFGRPARRFAAGVILAFVFLLLTFGLTNRWSALHQNPPRPAVPAAQAAALPPPPPSTAPRR